MARAALITLPIQKSSKEVTAQIRATSTDYKDTKFSPGNHQLGVGGLSELEKRSRVIVLSDSVSGAVIQIIGAARIATPTMPQPSAAEESLLEPLRTSQSSTTTLTDPLDHALQSSMTDTQAGQTAAIVAQPDLRSLTSSAPRKVSDRLMYELNRRKTAKAPQQPKKRKEPLRGGRPDAGIESFKRSQRGLPRGKSVPSSVRERKALIVTGDFKSPLGKETLDRAQIEAILRPVEN